MVWVPLLATEPERERALEAIAAIADVLAGTRLSWGGLADGQAGIALFLGRLAHALPSQFAHHQATATTMLDDAAAWIASSTPPGPGLFGGYAGLAWTGDHLSSLFGNVDFELNADIDAALVDELSRPGEYDLGKGAVGMGVYALERLAAPLAPRLLELAVSRLETMAELDPPGRSYHFRPLWLPQRLVDEWPQGYRDLGMAHGVPGVIAFLARCVAIDHPACRQAAPLMRALVTWLLARRCGDELATSFAAREAPDRPRRAARSAWCYGDGGIAISLARAARLGDPAWHAAAVEIARRAVARPDDDTGVIDATLCHGAAGLAHLYARLFDLTQEHSVRNAALHWIRRTLDARTSDPAHAHTAGFVLPSPTWSGMEVLEGIAGIGLVLLAAITSAEPSWDRIVLLGE